MLPKDNDRFEKGTELDGSENVIYCKLCYENGEFNG